MSIVKALITDLRERRLWPIAVAMVVALAAVPVLLSRKAHPAPVAQAPAGGAVASQAASLPVVSVQSTPSHGRLIGAPQDPFPQPTQTSVPNASSGSTHTVPPTSGGAGGGSGAGGSGASQSSSTPSEAQPTTTATTAPPVRITWFHWAVNLAFGKAGKRLRAYDDAKRFTTLPSPRNPLVVFLGLMSDAKTAVFLVSSTASPAGPGRCTPSLRNCEFLKLKAGQQEALLTVNANGSVTEYALEVTAVHLVQNSQPTAAPLAPARTSNAGRKIVARAARASSLLRQLSYSPRTGLLTFRRLVSGPTLVHLGRLAASAATGVMLRPVSGRSR
jgi:hypothetical protein